MLVCVFRTFLHARPRVQRAPGLPCALCSYEGGTNRHASRETRGEKADVCFQAIDRPHLARLRGGKLPAGQLAGFVSAGLGQLPSLHAQCAWRGGVGGGGRFSGFGARTRASICRATPRPRPLPTASREEGRRATEAALEPVAYTSTLALSELSWMNSRRGSTMSPISLVKMSSASSTSLIFTCSIVRSLVSSVVCQSCSGFISPRPL